MKLTALLPMKAHSERIPNKNIKFLGDRPLYHYVATILQNSEFVEQILINTDSDIIAKDTEKEFSKVVIIRRPKDLCGDIIPMNDIIKHDIDTVDGEHFLQTHSTNPLLTLKTLESAINYYFQSLNQYDSLFSVTAHYNRFYDHMGTPVNHNPEELLRTQDLIPLYEENSNFYIFSKTSFKSSKNNRIGLKPRMFIMNPIEAIDIDEESDWKMAEALITI